MSLSKELLACCILGTLVCCLKLSWRTTELQNCVDGWVQESAEPQLLNQLSLYHSYAAVAANSEQSQAIEHRAVDDEVHAYASARIQSLLTRALSDQDIPWLQEILQRCADHQLLLEPALLPEALDGAVKHGPIAPLVITTMGKRGHWLACQNSHWQKLVGSTQTEQADDWTVLSGVARLVALQQSLAEDADGTFAQLQQQWSSESARERAELLRAFGPYLKSEWLPVLQSWRSDRSKVVREIVVGYLARLSDEDIAGQVKDLVLAAFQVEHKRLNKQKIKIAIKLPSKYKDEWQALGVEEKLGHLPSVKRIGMKAGWLFQWLRLIDPSSLVAEFNTTLEHLIAAAFNSEFPEAIIEGMDAGACLFVNKAYALERSRTLKQHPANWLQQVANHFNGADLGEILLLSFKQLNKNEALAHLLACSEGLGQLSEEFCRWILPLMNKNYRHDPYSYNYRRKLIDNLAYQLPLTSPVQALVAKLEPEYFESLISRYQQRLTLEQEFAP